jgi:hypothetical protein
MMGQNYYSNIPVFREEQRFREWWIMTLIAIICISIWGTSINQLISDNPPQGREAMPIPLLIIFLVLFGVGFPMFFVYARLESEVRQDGIYVRFFPFHLSFRKIAFSELQKAYARTYRPILEYGGWGIRGIGRRRAFNVSGNQGVQLEFTDGRRLLIGSQQAEQFESAIKITSKKQNILL